MKIYNIEIAGNSLSEVLNDLDEVKRLIEAGNLAAFNKNEDGNISFDSDGMFEDENTYQYRDGGNYKTNFNWDDIFPDINEPEVNIGSDVDMGTYGITAEDLHERLSDAGLLHSEYDEDIDHNIIERIL